MRPAAVLTAVALIAAAGGGYWWQGKGSQGGAAARKTVAPPVSVEVVAAATADMPIEVQVIGRAEAYESVTLRARVEGQVAAVAYTEGQEVAVGQVLVRLDTADFAARLRQAEANLARDRANLAKARQDVERYAALRDRGFVSAEKVGDFRTVADAQAATVRADEAAVDLARLQLDYAVLRSPIAGRVGARLVAPGAAVKANDTPLAVVNRAQPIYVAFAIPEKYLPQLHAGMRGGALKVAVTIPGTAGAGFEGTVRFLDNAVDTSTGTIQMKAVLPNADRRLTPGQFLNISLGLDTLRDAVVIPGEAVQQGPQGSFVYAVVDGAAQIRKIQVAGAQGGKVAVAAGLTAGDTVVTAGQLRLTPGVQVRVGSPAKPSAQ